MRNMQRGSSTYVEISGGKSVIKTITALSHSEIAVLEAYCKAHNYPFEYSVM